MFFLLQIPLTARAAETSVSGPSVSLTAEGRYAFVEGDVGKFRAHHWMKEGFVAGVKEFSEELELEDDVLLLMEGHALVDAHDYGGKLELKKEDVGFIAFDYSQFRKYYDSTGGFYNRFTTLKSIDTDKELALDIGHFAVEAGLRRRNLPEITLLYEREFKQGTKSRLTWTSVTEGTVVGAAGNVSKKIGPSWQEIDEIVDKFSVKAEDDIKGFHWNAEQYWEFVRSKNMREEQNFSTTSAASGSNGDQKIRDQFTEPKADVITTILGLNRWFFKNKMYASSGYRFSQINSRELENIFEYDQNRVLTNFSFPEQVRDAHSDNLYTSHTWVGNLVMILAKPFSVTTKFKAETIGRESSSTYPKDNSPSSALGTAKPDGTINQIDVSENSDKLMRYGESISLRYTGIPRTAIYNEYEFEQVRSNLYEDRRSTSAGEVFNRQVITHMNRGSGTLGGQFMPWNFLTLTADVSHREDNIAYNNVRYTQPTATGAKSVFVDGQTIQTDELATRIRLKPCRWFQPAFRYQYQNKLYETWGLPDSDNDQEAGMISHIYTWDLVTQPHEDLLVTTSFSLQNAKIFTPARFSTTTAQAPTFNANVSMWLMSAEYAVGPDVILIGAIQHSRASNFNDFSDAGGLPLGESYKATDVTLGCRWSPKKDLWIEPKYSYYRYRPNAEAEYGSYDANVVWLEVKSSWG